MLRAAHLLAESQALIVATGPLGPEPSARRTPSGRPTRQESRTWTLLNQWMSDPSRTAFLFRCGTQPHHAALPDHRVYERDGNPAYAQCATRRDGACERVTGPHLNQPGTCPGCGGATRPNIDDGQGPFNPARRRQQWDHFQDWLESVPTTTPGVVIEIAADDHLHERCLAFAAGERWPLIRIHPTPVPTAALPASPVTMQIAMNPHEGIHALNRAHARVLWQQMVNRGECSFTPGPQAADDSLMSNRTGISA